ncbi:MAG: hypothetical protein ABL895_00210 [Cyclobacteriaceae bacterium]
MKNIFVLTILVFITSGTLSAQTLKFVELSEVKAFKRGKEYSIKWSGGQADQMIKIELYNHAEKVQSWDETLNNGELDIKLNSKLKLGKGYSFKILAGGDVVSSQDFQIKRKIPLAITISTAIIVPTVVILFSIRDEGGKIIDPIPPPVGN